MDNSELRQLLIDTAIASNTRGINQGTSGNVSVRAPEGFLITPSGMAYHTLTPSDIVLIDKNAAVVANNNGQQPRKPSSEWRFHYDIYVARNEVEAIVHTHSIHATALACLQQGIPAFHYMVAAAGGRDIRCSPYATYGTQALSDLALIALQDRKACLLGHHGVIATGSNLSAALALAEEVETLAHQYMAALSVGEPKLLSDEEMDVVIEKFKSYGVNAQNS